MKKVQKKTRNPEMHGVKQSKKKKQKNMDYMGGIEESTGLSN